MAQGAEIKRLNVSTTLVVSQKRNPRRETIVHKALDRVQVSSRSLIRSKNPLEVPYSHIELPLRIPTSSPSPPNPRTSIKYDCLSTRTPPIGEIP